MVHWEITAAGKVIGHKCLVIINIGHTQKRQNDLTKSQKKSPHYTWENGPMALTRGVNHRGYTGFLLRKDKVTSQRSGISIAEVSYTIKHTNQP